MPLEHGDYLIEVDNEIIKIMMIGAFNEFGIRKCIKDVKKVIDSFVGNHFCILSNATKLAGATPEAYIEIEQFNCWLNNQNMVAKAIVIDSQATLEIFDVRAPARKQQNIKIFNEPSSAMYWLKEELIKD